MIYIHCARYVRVRSDHESPPIDENGAVRLGDVCFEEGVVRIETDKPEPPADSYYLALIPRLVKAEYLGHMEKETA